MISALRQIGGFLLLSPVLVCVCTLGLILWLTGYELEDV